MILLCILTNEIRHKVELNIFATEVIHVISSTGLETHGGQGANGPRIFEMAPRFLRAGPKGPPNFSESPTYKYRYWAPAFMFGPPSFEERGPEGSLRKILSFEPCKYRFYETLEVCL